MQRRRRPATRIVKRNSSFDPNIAFQRKNDNNGFGRKILKFSIWVIIIGIISYLAYSNFYSVGEEQTISDNNTINDQSTISTKDTVGSPAYQQPEKLVQIEVLNGCGTSGIAKIFESYLRQNGFDVVNTDNYRVLGKINWNLPNSKVIDQIGMFENAEEVAEVLGIEDKFVFSNDNPSPICDVTVVIGKDFNKLKGFKEFSK